jgi:hypothetical protein
MKLARALGAPLLAGLLMVGAWGQSPRAWLDLLNAQPGREQPLTEADVLLRPSASQTFPGLVSVGFRQSDGRYNLGCIIWEGKVWTPLAGYAEILRRQGFAEADDATRQQMFLDLLGALNGPVGIHPYNGEKSRGEDRPQPVEGYRQVDGEHRFVVWLCAEPGQRDGPEWRQVLYLVDPAVPSVTARTLNSFHPVAEGLSGFPPIPSESSE